MQPIALVQCSPLQLCSGCVVFKVGEPIIYPRINEFLGMLHDRSISSFLVTNAQFPEMAILHRSLPPSVPSLAPSAPFLRPFSYAPLSFRHTLRLPCTYRSLLSRATSARRAAALPVLIQATLSRRHRSTSVARAGSESRHSAPVQTATLRPVP